MTRIRSSDASHVQDRRGRGGGRMGGGFGLPGLGGGGLGMPGKAGGGLIGMLLVAALIFLPQLLGGGGGGGGSGDQVLDETGSEAACDSEIEQILCGANNDVQDFWDRQYPAAFGGGYEYTDVVFFSGRTDTGCGPASAQIGPFYCPADHLVYFDLDFLGQLQREFGATGDLAAQYIVAHEFGHHIQNLTGQNQPPPGFGGTANEWSVLVELQADCYAGLWAHDAAGRTDPATGLPLFESPDEIGEAINAARAVGDDRIQQQTTGRVNPSEFTHGTSEQRARAFTTGYQTGDPARCDQGV